MKRLLARVAISLLLALAWVGGVVAAGLLLGSSDSLISRFFETLYWPGVVGVVALTGSWNWAVNHGGAILVLPFNVVFYWVLFYLALVALNRPRAS